MCLFFNFHRKKSPLIESKLVYMFKNITVVEKNLLYLGANILREGIKQYFYLFSLTETRG